MKIFFVLIYLLFAIYLNASSSEFANDKTSELKISYLDMSKKTPLEEFKNQIEKDAFDLIILKIHKHLDSHDKHIFYLEKKFHHWFILDLPSDNETFTCLVSKHEIIEPIYIDESKTLDFIINNDIHVYAILEKLNNNQWGFLKDKIKDNIQIDNLNFSICGEFDSENDLIQLKNYLLEYIVNSHSKIDLFNNKLIAMAPRSKSFSLSAKSNS